MKRTPIPWQSKKQAQRQAGFKALVLYLYEAWAGGRCEICGTTKYLWGHHIGKRAQCGPDTPDNTIILCYGGCHDHNRWATGMPISQAAAWALVARLNQEHQISWKGVRYDKQEG